MINEVEQSILACKIRRVCLPPPVSVPYHLLFALLGIHHDRCPACLPVVILLPAALLRRHDLTLHQVEIRAGAGNHHQRRSAGGAPVQREVPVRSAAELGCVDDTVGARLPDKTTVVTEDDLKGGGQRRSSKRIPVPEEQPSV